MYKVHGFLDNDLVINYRMDHLPRQGDVMRFDAMKYGRVTEVIWCMNEETLEGQRVNLRIESLPMEAADDD